MAARHADPLTDLRRCLPIAVSLVGAACLKWFNLGRSIARLGESGLPQETYTSVLH